MSAYLETYKQLWRVVRMKRIWKSSPLTKMVLSIAFAFILALLIFIGSLGIIAKINPDLL